MNKKVVWWVLGATVLIVLQISLFANIVLTGIIAGLGGTPAGEKVFEEVYVEGKRRSDKKIAVIDLFGMISYAVPGMASNSMVGDVIEQLRQAKDDKSVAAIVLNIESPGGEITASDTLYHEILKCSQVKPVLAYMNSMAASGAYYAAMGTQYIGANELCITGSIGVVLQTFNYQKLADMIGLKTLTFKSGEMKDLLNPGRPMTDEERRYVQGLINESYAKFISVVSKGRNMNLQELHTDVGDGRILSGQRALEHGLIDAVGYIEDVFQKAREMAQLKPDSPVVRYIPPFRLGQLFQIFGEAPKINLQLLPESIKLEAGKLYYLSPHLFNSRS